LFSSFESDAYRIVYRSQDPAACEHRVFVLKAVGVESLVATNRDVYVVLAPAERAEYALDQLQRYEQENSRPAPAAAPLVLHGSAGLSVVTYALVLVLGAFCSGEALGNRDWFRIGSLLPAAEAGGEMWRVVTALTLHADLGHLLSNLAFGAFFGYFAAQLVGPGAAWLSVLIAGAFGNCVDSLLMLPGHVTIGASTAVFATLGLVAAYAWKQHTVGALRWAQRWAPLVAAIALLAFTGAGGERTDVIAHLTGFASGALVGLANALAHTRAFFKRIPQVVCGGIALALVVGAWAWGFAAT
jgi:rhomboid protease GluP